MQRVVDYDIHGLLGVRLINPSRSDAEAVSKQLGSLQGPLSREPDVVLRFVKKLSTGGLRQVELNVNGFSDEAFFILQSSNRPTKVRIAIDEIGGHCELVCESGLPSVPLLTEILNLTVLNQGCVPVHASAFVYEGKGVVVTGWARCGKTEAVLAFAKQGAQYVGDEWVILSGDGKKMYGVPGNIQVSESHLENAPKIRRQLRSEARILFAAIHWLCRMQTGIPGSLNRTFPVQLLRRTVWALKHQLRVSLKPEGLSGGDPLSFEARPDKFFLFIPHSDCSIHIETSDPLRIARRMFASIRCEQLFLMQHYLASKFAFPGMRNTFIEGAHELESRILDRALAGKEAYTVWLPYPVSLDRLFEAMRPFVQRSAQIL